MRIVLALVVGAALSGVALAQSGDGRNCAEQAALVMRGVEARTDGADPAAVREILGERLPDDAAGLLTDWIFSLPDEQLTEAIGAAVEAQCAAL
jgi:hypothetical protein